MIIYVVMFIHRQVVSLSADAEDTKMPYSSLYASFVVAVVVVPRPHSLHVLGGLVCDLRREPRRDFDDARDEQ
jgi:hypothetical protein